MACSRRVKEGKINPSSTICEASAEISVKYEEKMLWNNLKVSKYF